MFIYMSNILFLLTNHSYEISFSSRQKQKFISLFSSLKNVFGFILKYKYSALLIAYIFSRKQFKKSEKNKFYYIMFTIPRIMLYFQFNFAVIFLFYNTLINVNDLDYNQLFIFCVVYLFSEVADYVGLLLQKIVTRINMYFLKKRCLVHHKDDLKKINKFPKDGKNNE